MDTWKERRGHEIVLNFRQELSEQDERTKGNSDLHQNISEYASDSSNESEKTFKSSESNLKKVSPVVHSAFSIDSILGKQDSKKREIYLGKESFRKVENDFEEKEDQDERCQIFNSITLPSPHSGNCIFILIINY